MHAHMPLEKTYGATGAISVLLRADTGNVTFIQRE